MAKSWLKKLIWLAILSAICVFGWFMLWGYLTQISQATVCYDQWGGSWECKSMAPDWEAATFTVNIHVKAWKMSLDRLAQIELEINKILKDDLANITIELKMEEE